MNIWEDPWLADDGNHKIQTPRPPNCQLQRVSDLLQENGLWDWNLIKSIFNQRDCNLIASIPRSSRVTEDKWIWRLDNKGVYTIKLGYKTLRNHSSFSSIAYPTFKWSMIWNQRVPAKVQNCMCRFLKGSIPKADRLISRRVEVSLICMVCNKEPESPVHTLLHCKFAMEVWAIFPGSLIRTHFMSLFDWSNNLETNKLKEEMELVCVVGWYIWKNMNEVVWNNRWGKPDVVIRQAKESLTQWYKAQKTQLLVGSGTGSSAEEKWIKPTHGMLKCNVDASIFPDKGYSSFGFVIKDANGVCVKALNGAFRGIFATMMVEALAFKEALSWIK